MTSTHSEMSQTTMRRMVRTLAGCFVPRLSLMLIIIMHMVQRPHQLPPFCSDPWLIRKEPKKGKKDKNKKKKKCIDPDSIQSALLASGLGSNRPKFTAPPANPTIKHAVGKSAATTEGTGLFFFFLLQVNTTLTSDFLPQSKLRARTASKRAKTRWKTPKR